MTLPRLLRSGSTEERRLLRSALGDAPSSVLRHKLMLSVGVSAVVAAESASALAASLTQPTAIHRGASLWTAGKLAVLVKWVGIASLALTAGTGAGFAAGSSWKGHTARPEPVVSARQAVARAHDARNHARNESGDHARSFDRISEDVAVAPAAATLPLPPPRAPIAAAHARLARDGGAQSPLDVSEEVRLVDAARAALRAGNPSACLRLLNTRQHRFPKGLLGPEAAIVRIEALHSSGECELVRTEGERFLVTHPSGPLAARVRAILDKI